MLWCSRNYWDTTQVVCLKEEHDANDGGIMMVSYTIMVRMTGGGDDGDGDGEDDDEDDGKGEGEDDGEERGGDAYRDPSW